MEARPCLNDNIKFVFKLPQLPQRSRFGKPPVHSFFQVNIEKEAIEPVYVFFRPTYWKSRPFLFFIPIDSKKEI